MHHLGLPGYREEEYCPVTHFHSHSSRTLNRSQAVSHTLPIVSSLVSSHYHRDVSLRNRRTAFVTIFYSSKREFLSLARGDTGFHSGIPSINPDLKGTS